MSIKVNSPVCSLWDFLSKRFFFHLDSEHVQYSANLKADLLKYYLVHAVKTNKRDRLTGEFFFPDFLSSFFNFAHLTRVLHHVFARNIDRVGRQRWSIVGLPFMVQILCD